MEKAYEIIGKLGITSKYRGYFFVTDAIDLAMHAQDKPIKVTKDIYPYLAKKYQTTPMNIERNVRTVITMCWETNKKGVDEIAGHSLTYRSTNSQFIDMVAYYLSEGQMSCSGQAFS